MIMSYIECIYVHLVHMKRNQSKTSTSNNQISEPLLLVWVDAENHISKSPFDPNTGHRRPSAHAQIR